MHIAGMGIICNRGRGIESLRKALEEGWKMPDPVYRVPAEAITDKAVLKEARRADDLSKMAVLACHDAYADSGLGPEAKKSLGIIVATAFGPHVTTFRFLDDILDYGDAQVSPTTFSHSVHNAAASYISMLLQSRGPTLTVTQFAHSFHQAVMLAHVWLSQGRCRYVLVGSVDQCGKVMEYICSQKLRLAGDGTIRPFLCAKAPVAVPGEGSAFFLVTNQQTPKRYASLSVRAPAQRRASAQSPSLSDSLGRASAQSPSLSDSLGRASAQSDMYILDCDGMAGSEEAYRAAEQLGELFSSYTPIFGSMLTVSSFSCAAAALMLKEQRYYAAPVQDNPHGLNVCATHRAAVIESISCVRYGCKKEKIELFLKR